MEPTDQSPEGASTNPVPGESGEKSVHVPPSAKSRRTAPVLMPKLVVLTSLILLFHLPLAQISSLVVERESRQRDANQEIASDVGASQEISGPVLVVPVSAKSNQSERRPENVLGLVRLFPDVLRISGDVVVEQRYRGIFRVPTYTARLRMEGTFSPAMLDGLGYGPEQLRWDEASIALGITDPHAIRDRVTMTWNETERAFEPGAGGSPFQQKGIHAQLVGLGAAHDGPQKFSIEVKVSGTESLQFLPLANSTQIDIRSDWPHPSFIGHHLPSSSQLSGDGFQAKWEVSEFGRELPQILRFDESVPNLRAIASQQLFGVRLFMPVDIHSITIRATKYASLLLLITFTTLFLFEICGRVRLHMMHYLLVGCGLVLFYLLLLSLGEHIGIGRAYALATTMIVLLIGGYAKSILAGGSRALILMAEVALQYGFFYVLLSQEDFALLSGSLGLTVLLGAVMYFTRNIDWGNLADPRPATA